MEGLDHVDEDADESIAIVTSGDAENDGECEELCDSRVSLEENR